MSLRASHPEPERIIRRLFLTSLTAGSPAAIGRTFLPKVREVDAAGRLAPVGSNPPRARSSPNASEKTETSVAKARERTSAQRQPMETELKLTFPPEAANRLAGHPAFKPQGANAPRSERIVSAILIRLATNLPDAA
jgi:hypothetical protein